MPRYSEHVPDPAETPPGREPSRLADALGVMICMCIGAILPLLVLHVSPRLLLGDQCSPAVSAAATTSTAR